MKVIYQDHSILRQIYAELRHAEMNGRTIKEFHFTEAEIATIKLELGLDEPYKRHELQSIVGIPFKVIDEKGIEVL
jgi:hypothetical protein